MCTLGCYVFLTDSCTDYYAFLLSSQKKSSLIKCHPKISRFYIATKNTDDLRVFTQNNSTDEHWSLHRLAWFVTYNCVPDKNPFKNSVLKVHTYTYHTYILNHVQICKYIHSSQMCCLKQQHQSWILWHNDDVWYVKRIHAHYCITGLKSAIQFCAAMALDKATPSLTTIKTVLQKSISL